MNVGQQIQPLVLGTKWYDCILIKSGEHAERWAAPDEQLDARIAKRLKNYKNQNRKHTSSNIWYSIDANLCFSSEQYKRWSGTARLPRKDHSFFSSRKNFLDGEFGLGYCDSIMEPGKLLKDQPRQIVGLEGIIGYPKFLEKFENSSVLIIGGGPSSNTVCWENVTTDFTWSINRFYLNDRVVSRGVDLATIAAHIELQSEKKLYEHMNNGETAISFELDRGNPHSMKGANTSAFRSMHQFSQEYPTRTTYFHTRYKSQPGVGMRMIVYAMLLGCRDIYFVGIDGFTNDGPIHCFEKDKENPNWYEKYGENFQIRQYITFWEYIRELKAMYRLHTNFYNLGEGNKHNISAPITREQFPLTPEINKLITKEKDVD